MTDRKTIHNNFCNYEIAKAKSRQFYRGGSRKKVSAQSRYTNYELREIMKKILDTP